MMQLHTFSLDVLLLLQLSLQDDVELSQLQNCISQLRINIFVIIRYISITLNWRLLISVTTLCKLQTITRNIQDQQKLLHIWRIRFFRQLQLSMQSSNKHSTAKTQLSMTTCHWLFWCTVKFTVSAYQQFGTRWLITVNGLNLSVLLEIDWKLNCSHV